MAKVPTQLNEFDPRIYLAEFFDNFTRMVTAAIIDTNDFEFG
jgi:hypothetical protein